METEGATYTDNFAQNIVCLSLCKNIFSFKLCGCYCLANCLLVEPVLSHRVKYTIDNQKFTK